MAWDSVLDDTTVAYAIAAAKEPRVRVIAGPGTGKSYAMKRRVARLLEANTKPQEVLAVTFTRVAAEDLHRELRKLGVPGCEELEGQTLHSLAMKILSRKHVLEHLGRVPRPLNRFELRTLFCDLAGTNGGMRACDRFLKDYEAAWAQSQGDEPGFAKTAEQKQFQGDFLNWCDFHRAMTIGELIPYLVKYLKQNPGASEHGEFKHLLVDEYQDLNKAEQAVIAFLGEKAEVCIVGDDDQSIYSFKSAHPDGIRQWKDVNPGCADLEMADCHRCPTTVVKMANALISNNKNRVPRELKPIEDKGHGDVQILQLKDLDHEASWIASTIKDLLLAGIQPSEIIILVQRRIAGRPILKALRDIGIPTKSYYDESQLDTELAQECFAYFKLFVDLNDRVALRYLLGAGSDTFRCKPYARLRDYCENTGESPFVAVKKLASGELKISHTTSLVTAFKNIQKNLNDLKSHEGDLRAFIDALFLENEDRLSDLRQLALDMLLASNTPEELLFKMMREISQPDVPLEVEEVRIMSLHKSKGLSSPFVFIAGCVEGILPPALDPKMPKAQRDALLEESRRLFYVGVTRVKADPKNGRPGTLVITHPQKMETKQAYSANIPIPATKGKLASLYPSRFIEELGPAAPKPAIP